MSDRTRMHHAAALVAALLAGFLVAPSGGASADDASITAIDDLDPAVMRDFTIDWQPSWQATLDGTLARWHEHVDQAVDEPGDRGRHRRAGELLALEALAARYDDDQRRPDAEVRIAQLRQRLAPDGDAGLERLRAYRASLDPTDEADAALRERLLTVRLELAADLDAPRAWIDYVDDPEAALRDATGASPDDAELSRRLVEGWFRAAVARGAFYEARRLVDQLERQASGEDDERWQRYRDRLLRDLGHSPDRPPTSSRPTFARSPELADAVERWRAGAEPASADRLGELLAEALDRRGLLPADEHTMTAGWLVLDRMAREAPVDAQRVPRADATAHASHDAMTFESLLHRYRRQPWDDVGFDALLTAAELALRRGWHGLAGRSLRDARERSDDAAVRERITGLLDAAPFDATREAIAAQPASPLHAPTALHLPPALKPDLWQRDWLARLSPHAVHRFVFAPQLLSTDHGLIVATPHLLASLDADGEPNWAHRAPRTAAGLTRGKGAVDHRMLPGPVRPAIADGRVIARWGTDDAGELMSDLAAFDLATGAPRWTTADQPRWAELWPVSDPTVGDGRVYVLAIERTGGSVPVVAAMAMACLDAVTGRTLWVQRIARDTPFMPGPNVNYDVVHFGGHLALADGAVYAATAMGMVARLDARDGMIDWVHSYRRPDVGAIQPHLPARLGAPPAVVGDVVVFVTRDDSGVFALDAGTGALRWRNHTLPAHGIAATRAADGAIVLHDRHWVVAIDAASGAVRWDRRINGPIEHAPVQRNDGLLLLAGSTLHELDLADGQTRSRRPLESPAAVHALAVHDRRPVLLHDDPRQAHDDLLRATPENDEGADRDAGHVALRRDQPMRWLPSSAAAPAPADVAVTLSDGLLDAVSVGATPGLRWQRHVHPGVLDHHWHEDTLVLLYPQQVEGISAVDGHTRWRRPLPETIHNWQWVDGQLLAGDRASRWMPDDFRWLVAIDLGDGAMQWRRAPVNSGTTLGQTPLGWDDGYLYLLHTRALNDRHSLATRVWRIDRAAGGIVDRRPLYPDTWRDEAEGDDTPSAARVHTLDGAEFFGVGPDRRVYRIDLRSPGEAIELGRLADNFSFGWSDEQTQLHVHGQWLEVRRYASPEATGRYTSTLLHREGNHPPFVPDRAGLVRGDAFYVADDSRLRIIGLSDQRERASLERPAPGRGGNRRLVDLRRTGDHLILLHQHHDGTLSVERLDAEAMP